MYFGITLPLGRKVIIRQTLSAQDIHYIFSADGVPA